MKGIITVLGHDRVGIIARVCVFLSGANINILDISQTIVQGFFNMVMVVDLSGASLTFEDIVGGLNAAGDELGVQIKLQREEIFNSMHRI
ncbi:MAG: ACT domain-containing protein [Oscillospiraceae bacterium]|jgi:ACT domain-containing protein|nr:ACT domain-containing protein [Oscillospiraceae bacterium]